ncbi:nuclear transport factor 2 family protein [Lysobacter sp. KIS68-7]|uniref:YybH family protein n=1 Tax=Lysobacter sp. KIS68-7 TaxID=2904252 RepID=UPI001E3D8E45|nr:nuclear transport factor 2 family protein [Lysobacter sp. KIS68-7]UHQ19071.1 nuclear transport factor 2 family protein [Lysobacter sp. KIS68-7]
MRSLLLSLSLAVATVTAGSAFAQPPAASPAASTASVSPAAAEAAKVVDGFMSALVNGQFDTARQLMTPEAVVMSNGQVLGLRDVYIDGAARGDSTALRSVQRELVRRDVRGSNDVAWILSEKRLRPMAATANGPSETVIETMVLARTASGWKITHIHWSGRHG